MKTKPFPKNFVFFIVLTIFVVILGTYIGFITVYRYKTIVRGILGFSTLYLVYLLLAPPKTFQSKLAGIQIEFPNDIKYAFVPFLLSIIVYWSTQHFLDAVIYYLKMLFNN